MRIDLEPIVEAAHRVREAISAKSKSRASSEAYRLLAALPDPTWAETAPGCAIYYGAEAEVNENLNVLRQRAMHWLDWLLMEGLLDTPNPEWPEPHKLVEAIQKVAEYLPQNASTS